MTAKPRTPRVAPAASYKPEQRVTARPKQVEVCHQKLVRDRMAERDDANALFPVPADLSLKRARVRECSRKLAWKIISRYEWLGTLPLCNRFFGLFFDEVFAGGVACFSVGSIGAGGVPVSAWLGVEQKDVAYLARGACVHWAPKGSAPKLINWAARMTGAKVALAYSDTDAGEIGTVYQAAGWTCLGRGNSIPEYVSPYGRTYNQLILRQLVETNGGGSRAYWHRRLLDAGWKVQKTNPKIRYGLLLDAGRDTPSLVERFRVSACPYPKRGESLAEGVRGESSDGAAPGPQLGEGGSNPTSPLQIDSRDLATLQP